MPAAPVQRVASHRKRPEPGAPVHRRRHATTEPTTPTSRRLSRWRIDSTILPRRGEGLRAPPDCYTNGLEDLVSHDYCRLLRTGSGLFIREWSQEKRSLFR